MAEGLSESGTPRGPDARSARVRGVAMASLVFALDQATKGWALAELMDPPRVVPVTPFFDLALGRNRGVSFGLLSAEHPAAPWLLSALALAVVAGLVAWAARDLRPWTAPAVGLVAGGALGNVADRLRHGAVTDFLDFHAAGHHWPAFNLADTAIVVGVALLVAAGGRGGPAPAPSPAARS